MFGLFSKRPHRRLALALRAAVYALRGGFLVRPLAIALLMGAAGAVFSMLEEQYPALSGWVPRALFPSHVDPQVCQVILAGIATSIMTVVSIVFAILLMTLTLASMQFSPRILVSFARDRITQWTLGIFLGTFSYCMAALPAAHAQPAPFGPVATVLGAMLLALLCVFWLIFFIAHISQAISVNHIVDRIAGDTESVIDELMPHVRVRNYRDVPPPELETPTMHVLCPASGYIRVVDLPALMEVAKSTRLQVQVLRRVGHFVPQGVPLMRLGRVSRISEDTSAALLAAFDIGASRTLQQDVEFGVLQIADIALKAISPAVNDPSTAITCIDQLGRILIRWIARESPDATLFDPPYVMRVSLPWISLDELLDTAFEQIRHYSISDLAVSLRLLRALQDIASTTEEAEIRAKLLSRAERVVQGSSFRQDDTGPARLAERLRLFRSLVRPGALPLDPAKGHAP